MPTTSSNHGPGAAAGWRKALQIEADVYVVRGFADGPGAQYGPERAWYVFDAALQALAGGDRVDLSYRLPQRLFVRDGPELGDDFRAAFLDAWGLGDGDR